MTSKKTTVMKVTPPVRGLQKEKLINFFMLLVSNKCILDYSYSLDSRVKDLIARNYS